MKKIKIVTLALCAIFTLTGCFFGNKATKPAGGGTATTANSSTVAGTTTPRTISSSTTTPGSTAPGTTTPATTTTQTTAPATTTPATTTPATTTAVTQPQATTTPATQAGGIMGLDNSPISWSHGNPVDLSEYNAYYNYGGDKIYLSFDLGYEGGYTPQILDTLKAKGVKAVFFLTGTYISDNPAMVDKIIEGGHLVGNHGYDHTNMSVLAEASPDALIDDLKKWEDDMGPTLKLYRAPEGVYSERGLAILKERGYETMFWGAAYEDWDVNAQPDRDTALETIKSLTQTGEIVLLHPFKTNSELLGDYIDWVRGNGWELSLP